MKVKVTAIHNRTGKKITWITTLHKLIGGLPELEIYGRCRIIRVNKIS